MDQMAALDQDMAVADFLNTYFGGEANERLRWAVRRFAEGYDLADINFASTKALYREWSRDEGTQYHVEHREACRFVPLQGPSGWKESQKE